MLIIFFVFLVFYVYWGTKKQQNYKILEDGAKSIEASLVDLSSGLVMAFLHFIIIALLPFFANNILIPLIIAIIVSKAFLQKYLAYNIIGNYSRIVNKSNVGNVFLYMMKIKAFTIAGFVLISIISFYLTPQIFENRTEETMSLIIMFIMLTIPVIAKALIPIFEITRYCNRTIIMFRKKEEENNINKES